MNYWDVHGLLFLLFLIVFPRLTMLFTGVCCSFSGVLFWVGWLFKPRLTIAILATIVYWNTNPTLVILAWVVALCKKRTVDYRSSREVKYKR